MHGYTYIDAKIYTQPNPDTTKAHSLTVEI